MQVIQCEFWVLIPCVVFSWSCTIGLLTHIFKFFRDVWQIGNYSYFKCTYHEALISKTKRVQLHYLTPPPPPPLFPSDHNACLRMCRTRQKKQNELNRLKIGPDLKISKIEEFAFQIFGSNTSRGVKNSKFSANKTKYHNFPQ